MIYGDNKGLVFFLRVVFIQVVVIFVFFKGIDFFEECLKVI